MGHRGEKEVATDLGEAALAAWPEHKAQVLPQFALLRRFKFQNHQAEKPFSKQDYFHHDP